MTEFHFYLLLFLILCLSLALSMVAKAVKDLTGIVKQIAEEIWK